MKQADVIIVGAGPAGCSAAHFLARAGVRVILLDKETFPRDKSCGDGIGRASLAQLARIGLDGWVRAGCFQTPKYVRIGAPSGEIVNILIRARAGQQFRSGRIIPRRELDAALVGAATRAGANLMEGARATGMSVADGGASVSMMADGRTDTLECQIVIAADGTFGGFSRSIGLPHAPLLCVAARAYVAGEDRFEESIDLLFDRDVLPLYGWVFPVGDGLCNVGISMSVEHAKRRGLRDRLAAFLHTNPHVAERLPEHEIVGKVRGAGLNAGFRPQWTFGDRLLAVGDAAGLISPLTGAGIDRALISGEIAARHAASALARGDCSARGLRVYGHALWIRFGVRRALLLLLQRLTSYEFFVNLLVHLASHNRVHNRFAQHVLTYEVGCGDRVGAGG